MGGSGALQNLTLRLSNVAKAGIVAARSFRFIVKNSLVYRVYCCVSRGPMTGRCLAGCLSPWATRTRSDAKSQSASASRVTGGCESWSPWAGAWMQFQHHRLVDQHQPCQPCILAGVSPVLHAELRIRGAAEQRHHPPQSFQLRARWTLRFDLRDPAMASCHQYATSGSK